MLAAATETTDPTMRVMGAAVRIRDVLSPVAMVRNLWSRRALIGQFSRREVLARNRGSLLGFVWTLLHPLVMLGVYTFVFSVVWEAKWGAVTPGGTEGRGLFATSVFCGLVMWEIFIAGLGNAPAMIVSHGNFVKKVIFPLEVLPLASIGAGLTFGAMSFVILIVGHWVLNGTVSTTLWLFPLVLVPLVTLTAGLSWFVASLGVFLRDLRQLIAGLILPVLFFTTPIFYPLERVPQAFRWAVSVSPLAQAVSDARRTALYSQWPDWKGLGIATVIGLVVMQLGYAFFMKSKRSFADVL